MTERTTSPRRDDSDGRTSERAGAPGGRSAGRGRRLATAAVGGALVVGGLRRRSLGGAAMAVGGGWLVARGFGGAARSRRGRRSDPDDSEGFGTSANDDGALTVDRTITVGAPADELATYWRDPEQLTRIMGPLVEVTDAGEGRTHWRMEPPRGPTLSWETELVEDRPGEVLRWESLEGATIASGGDVRFRPASGDRGTMVTLRLRFDPPGGGLGRAALQRLGIVPKTMAESALRRFKSLAETGEIPTTEANPSARGKGDLV